MCFAPIFLFSLLASVVSFEPRGFAQAPTESAPAAQPSTAGTSSNDCTTKNNETPAMGPIRSQRVTDQNRYLYTTIDGVRTKNSVGWCYAYTAADLVSHKIGRRVSAADIAIRFQEREVSGNRRYSQAKDEVGLIDSGGFANIAIMKSMGGFCPEELIKSDTFGNFGEDDGILRSIGNISNLHRDDLAHSCTAGSTAAANMFPRMSLKAIAAITSKYADKQVTKWAALVDKACDGKRLKLPATTNPQNLRDPGEISDTTGALTSKIDAELDAGNIASIDYHTLKVPRKLGRTPVLEGGDPDDAHVSTLVGRELDPLTGQCMYKIRNSWGNACGDFARCKGGYFSVTRETLKKMIFGVTWLD